MENRLQQQKQKQCSRFLLYYITTTIQLNPTIPKSYIRWRIPLFICQCWPKSRKQFLEKERISKKVPLNTIRISALQSSLLCPLIIKDLFTNLEEVQRLRIIICSGSMKQTTRVFCLSFANAGHCVVMPCKHLNHCPYAFLEQTQIARRVHPPGCNKVLQNGFRNM